MTIFWRELGFSEDSADVFVRFYELDYIRTKNPIHVWNAILHINKQGKTDYPKWIRDYLVQSARNLKVCDPKPKGEYGVVAAFGFTSCSQLYERDIDKIKLAYDLMWDKTQHEGKAIDKAAGEVESELDQSGLKASQRGYLGKSAIVKLFCELKRVEDENIEQVFAELK